MPITTLLIIAVAGLAVLLALIVFLVAKRGYVARTDRTFMTHDDHGFKRALHGRGLLWNPEESIVKGAGAPRVEFVALDPATGQRRMASLLDPATGAVNLRPQYSVPRPFSATTADSHRIMVEARVQFSLNRDKLGYVYQLQDFALALETRIQSAVRGEIGRCNDEILRASLNEVEDRVVARLRKAEADGDEAGEPGVALGVNIHTATFTYSEAESEEWSAAMAALAPIAPASTATPGAPAPVATGVPRTVEAARAVVHGQGVLALRPQQLDLLADVFKNRDPASTSALLAILEMQTRQNIADALAASGQLVVLTAQELGIASAAVQHDAIARFAEAREALRPSLEKPNGAAARPG